MTDDTADWLRTQALQDTPEEVAARYDDWAQRYEDDVRSWGYTVPEDITSLLVERHPEGLVLDAGSGVGLVGRALVDQGIPAGAIVGVDASIKSLRRAGELGPYQHVVGVDLNGALPFDDDVFGGVVCGGVLSYIPDTANVVGELLRVARAGAPVVISQRTDLWQERDYDRVFAEFAAAGVEVEINDPAPYLPNHDDYGDSIQVIFVTLTAR